MNKGAITTLLCPECGSTFPISRRLGKQKKLYHRKKLYCVTCKKETNQIEIKDIDMFLGELSFINENELTEEEKKVIQLVKKRGN